MKKKKEMEKNGLSHAMSCHVCVCACVHLSLRDLCVLFYPDLPSNPKRGGIPALQSIFLILLELVQF